MNRAQRREKEKRHRERKLDDYAKIKRYEANCAVEARMPEIRDYVVKKYGRAVLLSSALTLRDVFGFGEKRLNRFYEKFTEINNDIASGRLTYGDIEQALKEECSFEIEQVQREKENG